MTITNDDVEGPTPAVRTEIEAYLAADQTRLGDVWRRTNAGESPEEIQAAGGQQTSGFVSNYRGFANAFFGVLPPASAVDMTKKCAGVIRTALRKGTWSPDADEYLRKNLVVLGQRATSEALREVEAEAVVEAANEATEEAEAKNVPGVYVYALPHYLRFLTHAESNRTLLKVGQSGKGAVGRFQAQTRTTSLPEEAVLLRIYVTSGENAHQRETQFHNLLEAIGLSAPRTRSAGTEWFIANLGVLDAMAEMAELEIIHYAEMADFLEPSPHVVAGVAS